MRLSEIRLKGDRVLCVYPDEKENKSAGGIIMPGAKEKPFHMKVVKVGKIKADIKPGDTVIFDQYSGSTVEIDGKEYLSLNESDIFGTIEKD